MWLYFYSCIKSEYEDGNLAFRNFCFNLNCLFNLNCKGLFIFFNLQNENNKVLS